MVTKKSTSKPAPAPPTSTLHRQGTPGKAGSMIAGTPPRPPKPPTGPAGMMAKQVSKPIAKRAVKPATRDGAK